MSIESVEETKSPEKLVTLLAQILANEPEIVFFTRSGLVLDINMKHAGNVTV